MIKSTLNMWLLLCDTQLVIELRDVLADLAQ